MEPEPIGAALVRDPLKYDGVSTPIDRRRELGIRGLVPPAFIPLDLNVERCMAQLRSKQGAIEQYIYLHSIQDVSERLYFAMLVKHTDELMPIVYTPTVGAACESFSAIYRGTLRGMYISLDDAGMIREMLDHWPSRHVTTIVITDGERILGLGDLGVNGMGIPIGKLALYTACAGIPPDQVLPVQLDVGTDNQENWRDPYYLGLKRARERGSGYDALVKEFFTAAQEKYGRNVLIQFEDFGNTNAFRLLRQYQNIACTFNDDIQGTAAAVVAALISSNKLTRKKLADHTFLFSGAGEAGTGIADLIAFAVSFEIQIPVDEAQQRIFMMDSKGLVTSSRKTLEDHKINYAHEVEHECPDLLSALEYLKPTVLIGVSARPNTFNQEVCEKMAHWNERPVIFALSNPTSKAECTAEEAYTWTNGSCIFCSGSPFPSVVLEDGRTFRPGQVNTAFIFPGVGLAALTAGMRKITDHDMLLAAEALASFVKPEQWKNGCLYPPLSEIRMVSATIAHLIASHAYETGIATKPKPKDMMTAIRALMYDPFEMEKSNKPK